MKKRSKNNKEFRKKYVGHTIEELCGLSDGVDVIIYVLDPKTHEILFVNEKTRELFGRRITGKKCYEVFQKRDEPCQNCTNKHVFGRNLGKTYTWNHQNLWNGRWYKGIYKAIKWPEGKYVKYGIAIDITEQKKMEEALLESEEFFRSVVENSYSGILILDDNHKIIYANDEIVRIGGYSKKEITGQDFRKFVHENSRLLVEDRYVRRQRGEETPSRYELSIVTKNHEARDVEIKSSIVRYMGGKKCTMAQLINITERKRIEEERKRFEESLSALNMYGQSLNKAKTSEEINKLILDAMEQTLDLNLLTSSS